MLRLDVIGFGYWGDGDIWVCWVRVVVVHVDGVGGVGVAPWLLVDVWVLHGSFW